MIKRIKLTIFGFLVLLLALSPATSVLAQVGLGHGFYGRVRIGGENAEIGSVISAQVDETEYGSCQVSTLGQYALIVQGSIDDGATINFYINDQKGDQTFLFHDGWTTQLGLTVPAAPPPPPPPPPAGGGGIGPRRVPAGTTDVRGEISAAGVFEESVTAFSDDELCTLTIPEGTVGLTEDLEPLDEITILAEDDPPEPPEDADIVLAYDLGPDGATFEPAITLTFSYDPADIPEGKDVLVVAYYDEIAEAWVYLEGVVDTVTKTITISISHFTTFAIIARAAPPPAPAAFSVTNLSVKPLEVELKEVVTISLSVANTGGTEGSYSVVLKINGVKEADKSITIAAGKSQDVSFSVAKEKAGSYSVDVDGLSASFTVVAPVLPPTLAPPEEEVVPVPEEVVPPEEEVVPVPAKPINWPVLGGVIGGVIVVGLLIFFLVVRRRALIHPNG